MRNSFPPLLAVLLLLVATANQSAAQQPAVSRIITVRDGLPQSYISSVWQDDNGFLWVATLNGLGRYGGRGFRHFWHTSVDSAGLRSNVILQLLSVGNKQLLLCYDDGRLDLLHTETEAVSHVGGGAAFDGLKAETSFFKTLVSDGQGLCWMMAHDGGVLKLDLVRNSLQAFSPSALHLTEPVVGLGLQNNQVLLFTPTGLSVRSSTGGVVKTVAYPFGAIKMSDGHYTVCAPAMRPNGDLLLTDAEGITIWNPASGAYKKIALPRKQVSRKPAAAFDAAGNYYFEYEGGVAVLRRDNTMVNRAPAANGVKGIPVSMHIDRSGVLWAGTNGYGLRQYNLRQTPMPGYENRHSFAIDVLRHYGLSIEQAKQSFLGSSVPFSNRTATGKEGIWVADVNHRTTEPELALLANGKLSVKRFRQEALDGEKGIHAIQLLHYGEDGRLWGVDQGLRLLQFDTQRSRFRSCGIIALDSGDRVNGMVERENGFYISSVKNFVRYNPFTGSTTNLTARLPSEHLLTLAADPADDNILWLGTLSDGLLRYNTTTQQVAVFNTATGLPNNTVYCILPGTDGQLWCSSNRGIFSFHPTNGEVRSFSSRDGLLDDEFNNLHSMLLPDSSLAFGGPLGYTVFRPSAIARDGFEPVVNLTSLSVSNLLGFDASLASLRELRLRHDQNFITAEVAAMQFDAPDKILYRYKLDGFDKDWIMAGHQNKAAYTGLPPGRYTLLLNASNTGGKWSRHIRRISIIIAPPFWMTWWFVALCVGAVSLLVVAYLQARIARIKKLHAQRLAFERQATELHAVALRAQMNPHFIFNCLNSIKALIQEGQNKTAVRYLTTFTTLVRKQLNNTKNEVSLADELATCRLYLELEAMRFDGRVRFGFDVADDELLHRINIPPLTLQPVIENAIIHGLLPKPGGGTVNIRVYSQGRTVCCEIEDDGIGREAAARLREGRSRLHESKGVSLLEERIGLHNRLHKHNTHYQTLDLMDADGQACGTLVTIKFNNGL